MALYSCSSSNDISSFGKRKYTKGYFNYIPAEKPGVVSKAGTNKLAAKPEQIVALQDNVIKDSVKSINTLKESWAYTKKQITKQFQITQLK